MDELDGDLYLEANGDELDGTPTADDPIFPAPGERWPDPFEIGDPGDAEDDDPSGTDETTV
jgi:hypothetical protein